MNSGKKSVLVFIFHLTFACNCLKVIPERTSITYVNETYFTNMSASVRRISRGGAYVANLQFVSKLDIGYDVMLDLIFYEYLHNEFKRSFVEMHFNACNLILTDPYIGSIVRKAGLSTCPIPPGNPEGTQTVAKALAKTEASGKEASEFLTRFYGVQGKISLKNVNLNTDIPSVWPFEKGKLEVIATDNSTGTIMARGEIVLTFKPK